MTTPDFPVVPLRRLYVERVSGAGPRLAEALLAVAELIRRGLQAGLLTYAGSPPRRIDLTVPALEAWLDEMRRQRSAGIPALMTLSAGPEMPAGATVTYEVEPWAGTRVEYLWCSVPDRVIMPADGMLHLVAAMTTAFGAHMGAVQDDALMVRYRGARASQRALDALPEHLRPFVPVPSPEPASSGFPQLLVPQEFDRRLVPDAVWWINVWDAVQVATIGARTIRQAPWARITDLPDGGLALAATEQPASAGDPEHVARLRQIVEALGLRTLQEAHRLPGTPRGG